MDFRVPPTELRSRRLSACTLLGVVFILKLPVLMLLSQIPSSATFIFGAFEITLLVIGMIFVHLYLYKIKTLQLTINSHGIRYSSAFHTAVIPWSSVRCIELQQLGMPRSVIRLAQPTPVQLARGGRIVYARKELTVIPLDAFLGLQGWDSSIPLVKKIQSYRSLPIVKA